MALSIQKLRDHVRELDVKVDQAALLSGSRSPRAGRDGKDAANLQRDIEGDRSIKGAMYT